MITATEICKAQPHTRFQTIHILFLMADQADSISVAKDRGLQAGYRHWGTASPLPAWRLSWPRTSSAPFPPRTTASRWSAHVARNFATISDVTLRCTVQLTVLRYGTVITVHHRIFYGFCKLGTTVLRSVTVRATVRSRIFLDGKLP